MLQNQEEQEGNNAREQGAEQQDDPEGNDAPANDDVAEESMHNEEQGGEAAPANNAHTDNEAEDAPRAACVSPMFNSLRGFMGNGGTGAGEQHATASLTFDDENAETNFENQLLPPPPAHTITQQQEEDAVTMAQGNLQPAALLGGGGQQHLPNPPPAGQFQAVAPTEPYSGLERALKNLGHTLYSKETINAKLVIQSGVNPGDAASRAAFRDFVVNVQQLRVYLAMLGGQSYVTMVHTPGVYYSIAPSTSTYQGKVLAFIGDQRATKEPTLVYLPATKTWEWHTGHANCNFDKLTDFYAEKENKGKLWTPGAGDGATKEAKVPNLLAIPNALVDLLRTQGPAITPYDVLATINDFISSGGHPGGQQWDCVKRWCLLASQAGTNGKSKVFLDTSPVTINDEEFDRWVGNRLDVSMGPHTPAAHTGGTAGGSAPVGGAGGGQQALDYLALSKLLATTIGANMMQFSQAISPQGGGLTATGADTALATGKGFDQDQIAKLKDACGMLNAKQIPAIWSVIQATKGKSIDVYHAHIKKGDAMDEFADAVIDCIGKGVLYYTNLPAGAGSPNNKRKGGTGAPTASA